ncbi:MAG: hypothetical protein PWQ25_1107 [Deferribacteres bacterium]|jgi:cysteinyl-tRNA synthetase|nr:hypothetical protein [Deferribacteraceae bacterium]MDK2792244.1 hypothetical protein [Deferribacteres bacterium]
MKKLSDFFEKNLSKSLRSIIQINAVWKKVVGDQISRVTLPVRINKNVLNVLVFDPIWQHELSFLKEDILQKLPTHFKISDIKFFVNYKKFESEEVAFRQITEKEKKIIERLTKNINDKELQVKVKSAMEGYFRNYSYEDSLFLE